MAAKARNGRTRDSDATDGQGVRVLLAQDEPESGQEIAQWLTAAGYDVRLSRDGRSAVDMVHIVEPALLVLDLVKPTADGLEVCRLLRRDTASPLAVRLPIIVVRSDPDEIDEVVCLEVGADDYIGRPVHRRRLVARVRALLRRAEFASLGDRPEQPYIEAGDLALDLVSRRATRGGEPLPLTPLEFDLLSYFVAHRGQVITRNQILARVWHEQPNPDNTSLNVHLHWLRDKIEADPSQPARLQTLHGRGYVFVG